MWINALFQIQILQLWLAKLWCGLGEELCTLSKSAFEVIIPFQNTYLCEAGFSSKTVKWNSDLDWSPKMAWEYHFQPLFPECQILCVENKHKSITESLASWNCLSFFNRRKIKHGWLFLLTFCPLTQWYAGSYETVFRISTTSANHFLKVSMLTCKSILLKFHIRYRQCFVQALPYSWVWLDTPNGVGGKIIFLILLKGKGDKKG